MSSAPICRSSSAETARHWAPLRTGLKGLNAFCWGRASTDLSLHALWRGPLAFVSPNNNGTRAQTGKAHCSHQPIRTQQKDVYVICDFFSSSVHVFECVCEWQRKGKRTRGVSLSHLLCDEGGRGTSHRKGTNQILAVWIYARVFWLESFFVQVAKDSFFFLKRKKKKSAKKRCHTHRRAFSATGWSGNEKEEMGKGLWTSPSALTARTITRWDRSAFRGRACLRMTLSQPRWSLWASRSLDTSQTRSRTSSGRGPR